MTEDERKKIKLASLVQGKPVVELLRNNKREQEHPANAFLASPPYTVDPKSRILAFSARVVALHIPLSTICTA